MEYLGFWVTRDGIKTVDKKHKQLKYEAIEFPKIGSTVNKYIGLLP